MDMWIWTSWLVSLLISILQNISLLSGYIFTKSIKHCVFVHLSDESSNVKRAMYMGRSASPVRISLMAEKEKNKVNANF